MSLAINTDNAASLRRAAILLTTLEPGLARRMLDALPPARRTAVRQAMTTLADVDPLERRRALQDFLAEAGRASRRLRDSDSEAFHPRRDGALAQAATPDPSEPTATPAAEPPPLAFLGGVRDDVLLSAVAGEHPQTVAIVLASLAPQQAARLLPRLDESLRQQAMLRLGRLDQLPPDALDSIGEHLRRLLADTEATKIGGGAGGRSLMAILAELPPTLRGPLAQSLDLDPEQVGALGGDAAHGAEAPRVVGGPAEAARGASLRIAPGTQPAPDAVSADSRNRSAQEAVPSRGAAAVGGDADGDAAVVDPAVVDRHLMSLPPHRLRDALASVPARDALLALCGLQADVAEAVLALLPRRQARQVRKQLQAIGPLRLRDIDLAKQRIAVAAGLQIGSDPPNRLPLAA